MCCATERAPRPRSMPATTSRPCARSHGHGRYPRPRPHPLPERGAASLAPLPQRPDTICMSLAVKRAAGPGRILDLATDLVFAGEAWSWVWDAMPLFTADSALEPHELAKLLQRAFFSPSDDASADSWERQRDLFDSEAHHLATRLCVSEEAAQRASIAEAVTRELFFLISHDRGVDIAVRDRKVAVTLGEPAPQPAS